MTLESQWPKMSRPELVDLARRILRSEGSEEQINAWAEQFEAAVLMPDASMLLFFPENHIPKDVDPAAYQPTPEEIVDRVLSHRSILLGAAESSSHE